MEKSEPKVLVPTSGLGTDWGVGYEYISRGCGFGGLISEFEGTGEIPRSWVNSLNSLQEVASVVGSTEIKSVHAVLNKLRSKSKQKLKWNRLCTVIFSNLRVQ